jgi:hypothetical protein
MIPTFSTTYFGNISFFSEIIKHKSIVFEAKEHFIKQTYRNRCEILTSNGVQQLSIPVIRKNGSKTSIDEIILSHDTNWRKDHWKAIESAYSSSPYFEHYGIEVKELIYQEETNLLKFNAFIFDRICTWLGIDCSFSFSEEYLNSIHSIKNIADPKKYIQVFSEDKSFYQNLSILDAIFCLGPMARKLIQ